MNSILKNDINEINNCDFINWNKIDNHTLLVTGSTGLIGSILVKSLLKRDKNINFILPVRSIDKAINIFGESDHINYIETSIENFNCDVYADYVIHAASPTKSNYFITKPIETLNTMFNGTMKILDYCVDQKVKSAVYLSSMEMYGSLNNSSVNEKDLGYIDPLNVRSSYSEGKRVSELLCYSYASEKNCPIKIARVAMTFGAGIPLTENRVYKYFCDCIINNVDIELKTSGSTIINFSYTVDTILGILKILIDGLNGEAYNVVGNKTEMTIKDSAQWLIDNYGNSLKLKYNLSDKGEYAPENLMILDNSKLKKLDWYPSVDIKEGYKRLLDYLKEESA